MTGVERSQVAWASLWVSFNHLGLYLAGVAYLAGRRDVAFLGLYTALIAALMADLHMKGAPR